MDNRMYVKDGSNISEFPVSVQRGGKGPRGIIIILILLFVGVLAYMGYRYMGASKESKPHVIIPTPTSIPSPTQNLTPTASPSASPSTSPSPTTSVSSTIDKATKLDRAKLNVSIQNGSGVPGAASKMSALLTKLGYNIAGSGNADVFTYTNVTIKVKAASSAYLALLKKDLGDVYTVDTTTKDLPATSASDAVVIVGK